MIVRKRRIDTARMTGNSISNAKLAAVQSYIIDGVPPYVRGGQLIQFTSYKRRKADNTGSSSDFDHVAGTFLAYHLICKEGAAFVKRGIKNARQYGQFQTHKLNSYRMIDHFIASRSVPVYAHYQNPKNKNKNRFLFISIVGNA